MPNWCENDLEVSGDEPLVRDFLAFAWSGERALDFNRFVPYPSEFAELDRVAEAWRDAHPEKSVFSGPTDGFNSGGFEWCVEHWGTKWNARRAARGGVTVRGVTATVLVRFDTPWRPPLPVISAAARRFPSLAFDLRWYERGMQVQGRYRCRGEEVLCDLEWEYFGHRGG
ncbi:MAG: hypothetical protein C0501_05115 [Isosphaera sp.]|jgi:hypothetical protein|nr:hypothetical protein [Isosphaera sp.]